MLFLEVVPIIAISAEEFSSSSFETRTPISTGSPQPHTVTLVAELRVRTRRFSSSSTAQTTVIRCERRSSGPFFQRQTDRTVLPTLSVGKFAIISACTPRQPASAMGQMLPKVSNPSSMSTDGNCLPSYFRNRVPFCRCEFSISLTGLIRNCASWPSLMSVVSIPRAEKLSINPVRLRKTNGELVVSVVEIFPRFLEKSRASFARFVARFKSAAEEVECRPDLSPKTGLCVVCLGVAGGLIRFSFSPDVCDLGLFQSLQSRCALLKIFTAESETFTQMKSLGSELD
mmetsp:Transcript_12307/g.26500  ORF Transcript_12307/g.26500 Transcript_12307/m.26500 type:complete len:286 (-) Transcript_12307:958-1815(-)